MYVALLVTLIAVAGCGGDDCTAPEQTTYSREPTTDGSAGCVGGPVWTPHGESTPRHEDPDKVFPVGTMAEVPECGCCYQGGRVFECGGGGSEYGWGELL